MWGNDFPHPEGTWPYTREFLRSAFWDIPVDETAQILGATPAEFYGFDLEAPARRSPTASAPRPRSSARPRPKPPPPVRSGRHRRGAAGPWVSGIEAVPVPVRSTDAY